MSQVSSGDVVRIHYTGRLPDGTQFDSSSGREPLEFKVGGGQIIPGLDRQIEGMAVGESGTLTIPADEAYGPRDENQIQTVSRTTLPPDLELSLGTNLQATTQDGGQIALTVVDLTEEEVTVDANHPLAGQDLIFDVEVVEIVEA
ncbi:FKBP-type peptidyl-prolyl cis-trans isomerase [Paracoccus saliphilus]|uniref:Peptidyl-prolyl cis-trans isomerase n=1 Tax=Paracoccus saliphilus TaxID=405559 RepID=A0AA46A5D4_9RHOB|nr:peptidylprolyl isomerase [Paracoccus saliphilus]WCR04324.1 peptidylprolyl isomerase [Paracoccus saliphilus]SIS79580.1 peptidylprolyl isomerase [Paracoccus saliphilus]